MTDNQKANKSLALYAARIIAVAVATSGSTREKAEVAIQKHWISEYPAEKEGFYLTFKECDEIVCWAFFTFSAWES